MQMRHAFLTNTAQRVLYAQYTVETINVGGDK